ncbi:hypothetical protein HK103_001458 [Boothiomyces macroporosus]|uniref:Cytochrome b5 heme-binding domain-containing protein n=1 Tax=Boothiomyces macroporosus TaxID=261099 RepID=A0AAD5UKE4_9FUNG|nr:hypothetical protein HK103_001458 [Boothiomyces macroporosus]
MDSTDDLKLSWAAVAFGTSMRQSQMIVCHNVGINTLVLHEHQPRGQYLAAPIYDGTFVAVGLSGLSDSNSQTCVFQRPFQPNDSYHFNLDPNAPISMLWSFNPATGINWYGAPFTFHQPNHRGAFEINFSTGEVVSTNVPNFTLKQTHGFSMMFIWLVLFPFGVFYARHFRSYPGWLWVKIGVQSTGVVLVLCAILIAVASIVVYGGVHTIFGTVIASTLLIQITLGVFSRLGLQYDTIDKHRTTFRFFHRASGFILLICAAIQAGLGLEIMYPLEEPRETWPWVLYITVLVVVVSTFLIAEILKRARFEYKDLGYQKLPSSNIDARLQNSTNHNSEAVEPAGKLNFTWESLDKCINAGKMYVVANGKYVYDISMWINSHPGGRIILDAVNGTAGFDAEEYVAKPIVPNRLDPRPFRASASAFSGNSKFSINDHFKSQFDFDMNAHHLSTFDEVDWKYIKRSRRTHIHSRLAIETLASLMVGRMTPKLQSNASVETAITNTGRTFEVHEYRRYALTKIAKVPGSTTNEEVVRLRFCLLYPFDIRDSQPLHFLPGQSIEIQTRVNGNRISRYYTPISGNMNAFEILVKVKPGGAMSQYLAMQECGNRQFKIRGPFGSPLLYDYFEGYNKFNSPETAIFITGGSGITPCVQLVNHLYLSTGFSCKVTMPYAAQLSDELTLNVGESARAIHQYNDGWCYGTNLVTGHEGSYPVSCVTPLGPVKVVLIHVSAIAGKYIGSDIIEGAKLAYPHLLRSYIVSPGDLGPTTLLPIIEQSYMANNTKIFICGPESMNRKVSGMLEHFSWSMKNSVYLLGNSDPEMHQIN